MALIVGGGLTSAGVALGQDGAGRTGGERVGNGCFERNDINGDGEVTAAEARVAALVVFDSFDADGDGSLNRAEALSGARRWRQSRFEAYFAARDADGDGVLDSHELGASPRLWRWDGDADRRLTQQELRRAFGSPKGGAYGEVAFSGHVLRWDADRDGVVTRAEAAGAAAGRFGRKDRNGDGVLTRTEARLVAPGGAES